MNIMITGRHIEVTEAIRRRIEELLEAYFADKSNLKVSSVRVILDYAHREGSVDILASMKNHEVLGHARHHDLYKAIDQAVERLAVQTTRHLKRVKDHRSLPVRDAVELLMA